MNTSSEQGKGDYGAELYRRYLNGDKDAFEQIMENYHDQLIHFIFGIVHNLADAEDIAADVFCDLIVHKHRFSFKSTLKTYIFSIAKNKSYDKVRKNARSNDKEIEDDDGVAADEKSLEERVLSNETVRVVHEALGEIKDEYAQVVSLTYLYGFSGDEICKVMKKSKRQVANLLYRGKEALKTILEKKGVNIE